MASLLPFPIENIHPHENKDIWGRWYALLNDNCCVSNVSCLSCFHLHCGRCLTKSNSANLKVAKRVPIEVGEKETHSPKGKKLQTGKVESVEERECHIQTIDALEPEMALSPSQTAGPCDDDDNDDDDDDAADDDADDEDCCGGCGG